MKRILKFIMIITILGMGIMSCEKDFTKDLDETQIEESQLKATYTVVAGESIQYYIDLAVAGEDIDVQAGTYNESLFLKDGVDINFQSGAIVEFAGTVISDGIAGGSYYQSTPVVCNITGDGFFRATAGYNGVINFIDEGTVITGTGDIEVTGGGGYGIHIGNAGGSWIDTDTSSHTINMLSGTSGIFYGPDMGSDNDFTVHASVYTNYIETWIATTGIEVGGGSLIGRLIFSGSVYSENYYAANIHGSNLHFHDAVIQSNTGVANWQEYGGDAIWVCGGNNLTFGSNVTLLGSPYVTQDPGHWWYGVWSIGNEGCTPENGALITCYDTVYVNMQYIVDSIAPDGTVWVALNWAAGSEDYVVALPPTNLMATVLKSTTTDLTLTWDAANLAYPLDWDEYKILKNGNQIGVSSNGNFTDPNPSSGIYTVSSTMTGWPVNDGEVSVNVEIGVPNPVTDLTFELTWKNEKYVDLSWDAIGDGPFIIHKDGVLLFQTTNKTYKDWLTPPLHEIEYTVYNTELDLIGNTIIVSRN